MKKRVHTIADNTPSPGNGVYIFPVRVDITYLMHRSLQDNMSLFSPVGVYVQMVDKHHSRINSILQRENVFSQRVMDEFYYMCDSINLAREGKKDFEEIIAREWTPGLYSDMKKSPRYSGNLGYKTYSTIIHLPHNVDIMAAISRAVSREWAHYGDIVHNDYTGGELEHESFSDRVKPQISQFLNILKDGFPVCNTGIIKALEFTSKNSDSYFDAYKNDPTGNWIRQRHIKGDDMMVCNMLSGLQARKDTPYIMYPSKTMRAVGMSNLEPIVAKDGYEYSYHSAHADKKGDMDGKMPYFFTQELLDVYPMFLSLYDFAHDDSIDDTTTLHDYLADPEVYARIQGYISTEHPDFLEPKGTLERPYFEALDYIFTKPRHVAVQGSASFLVPTAGKTYVRKEMSKLTQKELRTWLDNKELEFRPVDSDPSKKEKLALWKDTLQDPHKLYRVKKLKDFYTLNKKFRWSERTQFGKDLGDFARENHNYSNKQVQNLYFAFNSIIKPFIPLETTKPLRRREMTYIGEKETKLLEFVHAYIDKNSTQGKIENMPLYGRMLIALSLASPGTIMKGASVTQIQSVIVETFSALDYDFYKLSEALFFLYADNTFPAFSRTEWKKFIKFATENGLDISVDNTDSLSLHARLFMKAQKGVNTTRDKRYKQEMSILREYEKSIAQ